MFTYDPTTNPGLVRLLISDTRETTPLFQDAEIDAFLALEGDNVKRAAATAKEAIATDQVLLLKVIERLDLKTDGAAVARELRMQAAQLRQQAQDDEATEAGGAFDIAEQVHTMFGARERLYKEAQRRGD